MSDEKYIPKSKLAQWFDSRLPLLTLSHHLMEYPTPTAPIAYDAVNKKSLLFG